MILQNLAAFSERRSRLKNWLGWLIIVLVVVTPRVFDLDIFYARDELAIWPWADEFTLAVWAGDPAATLTASDYPGIPMFWAQTLFLTFKSNFPALFPQTTLSPELLTQDRRIELLAERRLVAGLLVSLQLIAAVWLVCRLFGWPVALLSAILLGLDPFSLSEARLLRLEMTSALFVCLSLLIYLLYLRDRRAGLLLLSGVMAGLGVSSKTSAGLMVPYIWLLLGLDFLLLISNPAFRPNHDPIPNPPPARGRGLAPDFYVTISSIQSGVWLKKFKQMIVNGLLWAAGAVAAFWLIWPAMWVKPLETIQHVFLTGFSQAANRSVWGDKVFFWGQVIEGGDPGPFFYPVVFAFRTTPLIWLGLAAALWFLARAINTSVKSKIPKGRPVQMPWLAVSAGLLLIYIILITIELSLVLSKVDRFLLLIFPALNILAAIGLAALIEWLARYASRLPSSASRLLASSPLLIFLILALQLTLTLPAHPYFFTYWNPWVGGGQAAMKLLPIGAGEGIDQAMNFLNEQPGAAEKTLVCGASEPWCSRIFKGKTVRSATYVDGRWVEADYASFYISQLQRQVDPPEIVNFFMQQTPLYRVDLQSVNYVWVYEVPKMAHFAGRANDLAGLGRLLGYTFSTPTSRPAGEVAIKPGETVEATIWWTNWGAGIDNLALRWVDQTGYEWGRARIDPLPEYAAITPTRRAIAAGVAKLTIPLGTPPGLYFWRIGVLAPGEERLLAEFNLPDEANKLVVTAGQPLTKPESLSLVNPLNQALAPEVTLLGYDPPVQALTAAAPTWLTLYWQAKAQPPDYLVTLRLLNSAGQEVSRWQGQPGHGHYPTKNWRAGEIIKDVWALQVKPEISVGRYSLEVSLDNPDQSHISHPKSHIPNLEVLPQPVHYNVPAMQAELRVNFGDRLTLLGYDLYFDMGETGVGALTPVFYWQSLADFQETFDLLLTLRSADTDQAIKEWRIPLGAGEAKAVWKMDEVINTIYPLEAGTMGAGRYHLDMALQNHTTGQIELVKSADGLETSFIRLENIQEKIVVRVVSQ